MTDVSDRRGWHIDKGIPIAVMLTLAGLVWATAKDQSRQDERISLTESAVQTLQQARLYDQQRSEKKFDELKVDLRSINNKLDRLIEVKN